MVTVPAPDQCPDNPRNGPSEPESACPCAEVSKSPDTSTAFLRQLAEGFKEKKAMNLPFQFHGPVVPRSGYNDAAAVTPCEFAQRTYRLINLGIRRGWRHPPNRGVQSYVS